MLINIKEHSLLMPYKIIVGFSKNDLNYNFNFLIIQCNLTYKSHNNKNAKI